MTSPSRILDELIDALTVFPGIGRKSAGRMAFHLFEMEIGEVRKLAGTIIGVKEKLLPCTVCGGLSDAEICSICSGSGRDQGTICVVESARDLFAIEATGRFNGLYHVLGGVISPLDGRGPGSLRIGELLERCRSRSEAKGEIILALSPTVEGDVTALHLQRVLAGTGFRLTRIAHGLPVGSDLEFIDSATISRSLEGRREL